MDEKKIVLRFLNSFRFNEKVIYSDECINHLENSEIIITYIGNNNISNLITFYEQRLETKSITGSVSVPGYENLISKLSESANKESIIYIIRLYAPKVGYILFYLKENNELFYIIKNYNMSLEKEEERNKIYSNLGYQTSFCIKLIAGKIITEF